MAICEVKLKFIAGTDIEEASQQAYSMAIKLKMPIRFDFNGISFLVEPKDSVDCSFKVED